MDEEIIKSRSRSRSPAESSDFPFMIEMPEACLNAFIENDGEIMRTIRDSTGVTRIHFAPDLNIQGFEGGIAYIYDSSMEFKKNAFLEIIQKI